jgi:hypothetical protein
MKSILIENIDILIKGTLSGKIMWTKPADNVFVWQTSNSNKTRLNLILQGYRLSGPLVADILFRLYEVESKTSLLDVKTENTGPDVKKKIFQLYKTIEEKFDSGRIDILSDLLKDI